MFDVLCSGCGKRQLLTAGRIRGLCSTQDGIALAYQCWCGADGIELPAEPVRHVDMPLAG